MNKSRSMGVQLFVYNNLYILIHVDSELYMSKYVLITLSAILLTIFSHSVIIFLSFNILLDQLKCFVLM